MAIVGIIMGSKSDWNEMCHAAARLDSLGVPHEVEIVSTHRTPDRLFQYVETAESRGLAVIIAGAGGAAHLPGMCASKTSVPVIGVPIMSSGSAHMGLDALLSIVEMPTGVPVVSVGVNKAENAALWAVAMIARTDATVAGNLRAFREAQTADVLNNSDPRRR